MGKYGSVIDAVNTGFDDVPMTAPRYPASLLVIVATVTLSPTARADSDDTAFLDAVHNHGISYPTGNQGLINLGHMICNLLGQGYSMNGLESAGALHASNLSANDVKFLVQTSAAAYCPEYIK